MLKWCSMEVSDFHTSEPHKLNFGWRDNQEVRRSSDVQNHQHHFESFNNPEVVVPPHRYAFRTAALCGSRSRSPATVDQACVVCSFAEQALPWNRVPKGSAAQENALVFERASRPTRGVSRGALHLVAARLHHAPASTGWPPAVMLHASNSGDGRDGDTMVSKKSSSTAGGHNQFKAPAGHQTACTLRQNRFSYNSSATHNDGARKAPAMVVVGAPTAAPQSRPHQSPSDGWRRPRYKTMKGPW
jgi:hypothetical protein